MRNDSIKQTDLVIPRHDRNDMTPASSDLSRDFVAQSVRRMLFSEAHQTLDVSTFTAELDMNVLSANGNRDDVAALGSKLVYKSREHKCPAKRESA